VQKKNKFGKDNNQLEKCIDIILSRIENNIIYLSKDRFANYMISKLIEYSNSSQLHIISTYICSNLLEVNSTTYGNYVFQNLIGKAKYFSDPKIPIINFFLNSWKLILDNRLSFNFFLFNHSLLLLYEQ
jgi:hypothetical protein